MNTIAGMVGKLRAQRGTERCIIGGSRLRDATTAAGRLVCSTWTPAYHVGGGWQSVNKVGRRRTLGGMPENEALPEDERPVY